MIKLDKKALSKLKEFESKLDPQNPEAGSYQPKIIGYGEMSTVFNFSDPDLKGYAFKRMAIFQNNSEAKKYETDYIEYNKILNKTGISTPDYGCTALQKNQEGLVLYLSQGLLNPLCICHKAIHQISPSESLRLFNAILEKIHLVFDTNQKTQNKRKPVIKIGLDAQISNWCISNWNGKTNSLPKKIKLAYLDTSTPLIRKDSVLQLDPELFLRICPASLVWMIRMFFLKDVVERYFDVRSVIMDLIANLYKEKRSDLINDFIDLANNYLQKNWPNREPVKQKEIESYYKEDARIWSLFLGLRRLERWVRTKILHRPYDLILPGKISR